MKKLILINLLIAALVIIFIKANMNVSEKFSQAKKQKADTHLAVK